MSACARSESFSTWAIDWRRVLICSARKVFKSLNCLIISALWALIAATTQPSQTAQAGDEGASRPTPTATRPSEILRIGMVFPFFINYNIA